MTLRAATTAIKRFRKKYPELSKCNYWWHPHLYPKDWTTKDGYSCFNALDTKGKHFLVIVPCKENEANSEALLTAKANFIKSLPCPDWCK